MSTVYSTNMPLKAVKYTYHMIMVQRSSVVFLVIQVTEIKQFNLQSDSLTRDGNITFDLSKDTEFLEGYLLRR